MWTDRATRMPTRDDADEQMQVWAWMEARGVFAITIREFERAIYLQDWHPRIKQPKPKSPRRI